MIFFRNTTNIWTEKLTCLNEASDIWTSNITFENDLGCRFSVDLYFNSKAAGEDFMARAAAAGIFVGEEQPNHMKLSLHDVAQVSFGEASTNNGHLIEFRFDDYGTEDIVAYRKENQQ